jgi:hypothetical protein
MTAMNRSTPPSQSKAQANSILGTFTVFAITLASLGVGGYALVAYTTRPLGSLVHPQMQAIFETHRLGIFTHIFASSVAILLGPFQFMAAVRSRWPVFHRWSGRIYLLGVLVGGLAAIHMSAFAFGGLVSTLGFSLLGLIWLYTGFRAYTTARARDFAAHRAWMIRNFSLTLAAVTIRIGIGIGFATGLPFEVFYPALTWLCWVPNLVAAEIVCSVRKPLTESAL